MSKPVLHPEHMLIMGLLLIVLHAYGRLYRAKMRRWWRSFKAAKPRVWKPRGPDDCPQCREKISLSFFRPRTDVIPYAERKSPRGRKKTIATEGYTCPNQKCAYFGVVPEALHALVGNGKRGAQQIQYFRCQACHTNFSSRRCTPLYRLKTAEDKVIPVMMLLAEGCDMSVLVRCTPHAEQTISCWLERMGEHSRLLNQYFRNLALVFVQLDELYARVRQVGTMWLWLAIDPVSKILPALHLGKRTNDAAMVLAHDLQGRLEAGCVPTFTTDGLRGYFYALMVHFGAWFRPPRARQDHWQVSEKLLHG